MIEKLINSGFSLITADQNKIPNFAWKQCQSNALTLSEFEKHRSKDNTNFVGIVTGFNGLEVVDVDLKVFKTQPERDKFWKEYLTMLQDNIENFEDKFVIAKTINNGYHILYKTENPDRNKKLAKLKGMQEAVIETRGTGGYVVMYDAEYNKIKHVSEEDREILLTISKMYNYTEEEEIKQTEFTQTKLSPWKDFNEKTQILDLIQSEFTIVKKTSKATIIKRKGSKSVHSGYVFNNNRMFIFSTGTQYPSETLLTPFQIYSIQNHGGNYKEAGRQLYFDGFGSRENQTKKIEPIEENPYKTKPFPVNVFPNIIQKYIKEVSINANFSPDFLAVSIISAISTVLGKKVNLKINNTWETNPIFWFAVVGGPGSKKTHPVKFALRPLKKMDIKSKEVYDKEMEVWDKYSDADEFQRKNMTNELGKIKKPNYFQYVVKDTTIEALFYVHEINKNGILLYKDELIGFIKGMGQYKQGAGEEMEQYLSLFDGDELKKNRVTKEPLLIADTCVNLIGTIQPDVLNKIPRDNGFLQRFLFTSAVKKIIRFNSNEVDKITIDDYENFVFLIQKATIKIKEQIDYIMSPDARSEFSRIDNYLCRIQESEETDKFLNQYIEKLKTYLPRFALIISVINNLEKDLDYAIISKEDMKNAFLLVDYFLATIKYLLYEQTQTNEAKEVYSKLYGLTNTEKILELLKKGINKKKIAEEVGISRQQVYNIIKSVK